MTRGWSGSPDSTAASNAAEPVIDQDQAGQLGSPVPYNSPAGRARVQETATPSPAASTLNSDTERYCAVAECRVCGAETGITREQHAASKHTTYDDMPLSILAKRREDYAALNAYLPGSAGERPYLEPRHKVWSE